MSTLRDDWARARVVFEHALTLLGSARADYVAEACAGNVGVRQQVERMLASHAKAPVFLETPIAVNVTDLAAAVDLEGTQIGPYQIGPRLGAGGMGEVYSARDTRLGRGVAIKVLPSHVANDPQARERFDREARAIATLNHPHICVLHDVGEATLPGDHAGGGDPEPVTVRYLVMELLEGETLAARLKRGPLPVDEALQYAVEIASALNRAHQAGIIHRDLKPGNIFLVPTGGTSSAFTAKLLDFGLAKQQTPGRIAGRAGSYDSMTRPADLTGPGMIVGTVHYMAPEQIEGGETDVRTDVFAFGLVLFEMLTARKAFEADDRRSLLVAVLDRDPLQLSALQPLVPQWLDRVVGRCLAKNPDDRWQTARDVLLQLEAPRDDATVAVRPALSDRAKTDPNLHPTRRRRMAWAAAALSLVAVFGAAALMLRAGRGVAGETPGSAPAVQRASLAVLPIQSIDAPGPDIGYLGVGIADAIVTKLANVHSIRVRPTSATVSLEGRASDAAAVGHQLQVDHVLTGTVRRAGDAYRFNLQLVRATDDVLVWGRQIDVTQQSLLTIEDQVSAEVVAALQLQLTGPERARLSQSSTQNADAYSAYLQGRALMANYSDSNLREAMNHFDRALQIDPDYGLANAGLAMAAGTFSVRFAYEQQAADWGRRAEEYAARALKQDANLAEAHLALASAAGTLYRNFDWPTVIREAQVALTLNPSLDLAHSSLARAFYHLGLLDWSEIESTRAEETSGGTNLEVSRVHLYNKLLSGRFEEARQMAETLMTRNAVPVIGQYLGLASFYLGDRARAQDVLASVRRPDGRPDTRSQASLASVLAANGRRDEAERTIRAVLDSGYMDHHVAYSLGAAEAQLGRPANAITWLRTAAETGFPCYQWMERDTLLDPIRADQAFQSFLAGMRADYDRLRTSYRAVSGLP